MSDGQSAAEPCKQTWRPLDRTERRVVGVLIEKSKTTPELYPMTLNAVTTACNQKTNRYPLTNFNPDEVQDALDRLRACQAVMEVHADGRVPKFKHLAYEWLPVDKIELAVLAELLLRGQQTVGELRMRASRMQEIASQDELRAILDRLLAKDLIVELTPPGRGQMVTHNLYRPEELAKVRDQVNAAKGVGTSRGGAAEPTESIESHEELHAKIAKLENALEAVEARLQAMEKAVFG